MHIRSPWFSLNVILIKKSIVLILPIRGFNTYPKSENNFIYLLYRNIFLISVSASVRQCICHDNFLKDLSENTSVETRYAYSPETSRIRSTIDGRFINVFIRYPPYIIQNIIYIWICIFVKIFRGSPIYNTA